MLEPLLGTIILIEALNRGLILFFTREIPEIHKKSRFDKWALKQYTTSGWICEKGKNSKTGYARTIGSDFLYVSEKNDAWIF